MKKIIQSIGLLSLICFSFMYTDKVMEVISEKDSLMVEIEEKQDNYKIETIEATLEDDTIIPGINGKEVDVKESYKKMRELGVFREDLLVYYTTYPNILLSNNYDKYIISGNTSKQEVSLIFNIQSNSDLTSLTNILTKYNLKINIFADVNYLNSSIDKLLNSNIEIYSYGELGNYTHENILLSKNLIKSKTNKVANLCLTNQKKDKVINTCSKEKMFTIIPNIFGSSTPYNSIKSSLKNGSIINLELNSITLKELPSIIEFIKGKGLDIVFLSDLLTEENN
jgi:hypothetical protein